MNSSLITHLQTAANKLEIDQNSRLGNDLKTLASKAGRSNYQIAVFGPFNHGKSTLLNAILGNKTLPIDLIPTTGAAIKVVYGEDIATKITLTNGQIIAAKNTDILTEFAILDNDRRMRDDVLEVEVSFPHPFLQTGVELIDLPGTNDRDEQDNLVRDRLLAADLVVNVLDVRKLMTLGEREHLRDWLENRGINTVVFVANFTNMLEPEEQKEVQHRLRFVAESFRSQLPPGISNLYRVDALPALRARLKGDDATLHTSGLSSFISALQAIVSHQREKLAEVRMPVLQSLGLEIQGLLRSQIAKLTAEVNETKEKCDRELALKRQAQTLIQSGWETSLKEVEQWLYLPNLISFYQSPLTTAIQKNGFGEWESSNVRPRLQHSQQEINDWVTKAESFFNTSPVEPLKIVLPDPPEVLLPESPTQSPPKPTTPSSTIDNLAPTALATGLGWILGGPIGAVVAGGASTIANKRSGDRSSDNTSNSKTPDNSAEILEAYTDAAADYLFRLNTETIKTIKAYRDRAAAAINPEIKLDRQVDLHQQQNLTDLERCLADVLASASA
ncbi:dynamin family protein [Chamaesiphon minutus]|uniref:Dynamin family protein n=1 Tax=Chamaesiphon minutus (strain ATCC 27169 / PCC 6605) TaxID=1173020 RepID=K9UJR4_CHAP6|nr:dynamin family protein [Chamaesiphon minutus]AFY94893.1 dynamin family protein [Chamaesiphon minutus PCC 6605]